MLNELLTGVGPIICVIVLVVGGIAASAIRIVQEYERGVIFRLGRVQGAKGPGLFFIIPWIDRMIKVDLRTVTMDVPSQDAISADNVTVRVNAVVYFRVVDPVSAVIQVEDYHRATWQIAQTTLRNVIGQSQLDQLLSEREKVNERLQLIIDEATEPWGIKVSIVEVKDVEERHDGARDGPPGRSRARAARQDHPCRGRDAGRRAAEGRRPDNEFRARRDDPALSADATGNWRRTEHDDHLPDTGGDVECFPIKPERRQVG